MDFAVLKGATRSERRDFVPQGSPAPDERCEVTLKLRRKKELPEPIAGGFAIDTRRALSGEYGASKRDITRVRTALRRHGLECRSVNRVARSIKVGGSVAAMQKFFRTELVRGVDNGRCARARVGDLHIPSKLQDIIVGAFGLDDRVMVRARPMASSLTPLQAAAESALELLPSDWANHYGFDPHGDHAPTVGIVALGGSFNPSAFDQFCAIAGIQPRPSVLVKTAQALTKENADDPSATQELMLDVEIIAGVCPNAKIVVHLSNCDERGWVDALDSVVSDRDNPPDVVSISWALAEGKPFWTEQATAALDDSLKELACRGVVVCVSSGDDGASAGIPGGQAHVAFPASSRYVLSVGGTLITETEGVIAESAWNQRVDSRMTGGGVSSVFPRPKWQKPFDIESVNPNGAPGRIVPDVAASAGVFSYRYVVDDSESKNGGTSASAQLWAGLLARLQSKGHRLSFITPLFYQFHEAHGGHHGAIACRDIVTGDNRTNGIGYDAREGYDAVTGWGSPKGAQLPLILASRRAPASQK